jgi:cytochrome b
MSDGRRPEGSKVRAWDLPTRLFHWALVASIAFAWASYHYSDKLADPTLSYHRWNGHFILVLIVFRILWGLFGSSTARLSGWFSWPWRAAGYGIALLRGRPQLYLGHNPLGAYMILLLIAAVTAQAGLGLFTDEHNGATSGSLYRLASDEAREAISAWHRWWFYWVILALVPIHILANVLYGLLWREPLITAMITGSKPAEAYEDAAEAEIVQRPLLRALGCLVAATVIVFGTILALGGKFLA